jgi:DNA-directed RNA polymerase sigma subunit (sigma70/sigma32)
MASDQLRKEQVSDPQADSAAAPGVSSSLAQKVDSALKSLDQTSQAILNLRYGIDTGMAQPPAIVASALDIPEVKVEDLEANALRALMGYGPKAPKRNQ